MGQASAWFKHLRMRRGLKILTQAHYMWKLHRTPFKDLITNISTVLEKYEAYFTYPTVAYTALQDPPLVRSIIKEGHEIASHGYKHIRYQFLSLKTQEKDLKKSLKVFKQMGVEIKGFRAPYNMYASETPKLIQKYNFLWDGGIGYKPEFRGTHDFFSISIDNKKSSFTCIPLNFNTDDLLIDEYKLNDYQMGKVFKKVLKETFDKKKLVMFDLHPIRIGQTKYINSLKTLVDYGTRLGGWFPTVSEAVEYWSKHRSWKHDAPFCVLLTGDIDNFVFLRDYLSRLID